MVKLYFVNTESVIAPDAGSSDDVSHGPGLLGHSPRVLEAEELDRRVNRPKVRGCRKVIDASERDQ